MDKNKIQWEEGHTLRYNRIIGRFSFFIYTRGRWVNTYIKSGGEYKKDMDIEIIKDEIEDRIVKEIGEIIANGFVVSNGERLEFSFFSYTDPVELEIHRLKRRG